MVQSAFSIWSKVLRRWISPYPLQSFNAQLTRIIIPFFSYFYCLTYTTYNTILTSPTLIPSYINHDAYTKYSTYITLHYGAQHSIYEAFFFLFLFKYYICFFLNTICTA